MPIDLYKALKVRRDATPDEVRRAYRKLATKFHPDQNPGDESVVAKYHAVTEAYRVLGDPGLRARYDATGEVDGPDRSITEVMAILSPVLLCVMQGIAKQGGKVKNEDVVKHMRSVIADEVDRLKKVRAETTKTKEALDAAVGRFTVKGDDANLLESAARQHLAETERQLKGIEGDIAKLGKATEHLKRYGFTFEAVARYGNLTTTATATGFWSVG
jgi:curved DNA-binding protein CbpA